jgi:hypothetical protein
MAKNVMQTLPPRLLPFIAAVFVALAVGTPVAAGAESGGANNVVIATQMADGASLSRSGLQVSFVGGPTVASSNIAAATSYACAGCGTVAVALQAVLVMGDPSTVVPANAAVATNDGCNSCSSYAFAYQYVLSTNGPAYLSPWAQAQLAELRQEIADVAAATLSDDERTVRLQEIRDEFKATIDAALHPVSGASTTSVDTAPTS